MGSESLLNRSKPNLSSKKISSDRQRETNSLNTSKLNLPLRNHNLSNLAAQKKRHFSSSSSICTSFSMNNSNILNRTASSIAPSTSMNSFIGKKKQKITVKNLDDYLAKNNVVTSPESADLISLSKKRSAKQLD